MRFMLLLVFSIYLSGNANAEAFDGRVEKRNFNDRYAYCQLIINQLEDAAVVRSRLNPCAIFTKWAQLFAPENSLRDLFLSVDSESIEPERFEYIEYFDCSCVSTAF